MALKVCSNRMVCWLEFLTKQKIKRLKDLLVIKIVLQIMSTEFEHNGNIPKKFSCDGENINPLLNIKNIPKGTKSLALIMDDPDARIGNWVHWVLWNINPAKASSVIIRQDSIPAGAVAGANSDKALKYHGPCPPTGTHRYFFKVYALNSMLQLKQGSGKDEVIKSIEGHIIEEASLIGLYSRSKNGELH